MNGPAAIVDTCNMARMIAMAYLEDMTDDELMQRPHANCNHIKWQLGHLIASEHSMINQVAPGSMPDLPAGFEEQYNNDTCTSDAADAFHSKEELLALFEEQRAATLAALQSLSESDLDQPAPESMQAYAPTVGAAFNLQGSHWLMHAGQWAVLRRQLGRPPLF